MNRKIHLWDRETILETPLPRVPLTELCGDRRVLIENHNGIIAYGPEQITVKVKFGSLSVCGNGLKICKMTTQQLVISGNIMKILVNRETKP